MATGNSFAGFSRAIIRRKCQNKSRYTFWRSQKTTMGHWRQRQRGGVRVIYYFKKQHSEIWMLTLYGKSEVETIPAHILRQIAEEVRNV